MVAWMALIPAAISMAQQVMQQGQQKGAQSDAMQTQMMNQAMQQRLMDQQRELATASRTDARGNKTIYVPGQGWVSYAGPEVASQQSQQDDLLKREMVRQSTTGELQRGREGRRLVSEGSAADPLLAQFEQGFGMPTREGVRGKQTIANVTGASENADRLRNAATSTALRTGAGTSPLGGNLSSLDRNATAGIRTALAQGDVQGDQMFESMYKAAAGNKLDPYKSLTAGSTPGFKPTDVGGDAATSLNQAATVGAMKGTPSGAGYGQSSQQLAGQQVAGGNLQQPSWDMFAASIANMLKGKGGSASGGVAPMSFDAGLRSGFPEFGQ